MRRARRPTHQAARQPRPSRRIYEGAPGQRAKLREGAVCPRCGASYHEGRWTWRGAPAESYEQVCPACARIETEYPAGVVHVSGGFARRHRGELEGLVRHVEERERAQHPLKRIVGIQDEAEGFAVETTDAKLAVALGRALHRAYAGRLEHPQTSLEKQNLVRVRWLRD
jgi:NMD protein affecting ribosome stability and mRNA decay